MTAYLPNAAGMVAYDPSKPVGQLKGQNVFLGNDGNYYQGYNESGGNVYMGTPGGNYGGGGSWQGAKPLTQSEVVEMMQGSQQPQQQQQQNPLDQMWNQYQRQGAQQAQQGQQGQQQQPQLTQQTQQTQAAPQAQAVINQAQAAPGLIPTIPGASTNQFAPPPPPAPGQTYGPAAAGAQTALGTGEPPKYFQGGGYVQPSGPSYFYPMTATGNQQRQQGQQGQGSAQQPGAGAQQYQPFGQASGDVQAQGAFSSIGAAVLGGMPTILNPTPNAGQMGQGSMGPSGVYSGPQPASMYGNLTQEANPQQYVSQITLPNGITLTG